MEKELSAAEERKVVVRAANAFTLFADIVSSKVKDAVEAVRQDKTLYRHEMKKRVNKIEKARGRIEYRLQYGLVVDKNKFAEIAGLIEDSAEEEYKMFRYAVFNDIGKIHGIRHDVLAVVIASYMFAKNIKSIVELLVENELKRLTYYRVEKVSLNIDLPIRELQYLISELSDGQINVDEYEWSNVLRNAITAVMNKMTDIEKINAAYAATKTKEKHEK